MTDHTLSGLPMLRRTHDLADIARWFAPDGGMAWAALDRVSPYDADGSSPFALRRICRLATLIALRVGSDRPVEHTLVQPVVTAHWRPGGRILIVPTTAELLDIWSEFAVRWCRKDGTVILRIRADGPAA